MGLFNLFLGNNRRNHMDEEYRRALRQMRKQRSKAYRTLRMIIILAGVLAAALFIMAFFFREELMHAWLFKLVFIIFALCIGGGMCLPWITELARDKRRAQKGEKVAKWRKGVAFGFFGLIALSTLFWIISVFTVGDGVIGNVIDGNGEDISSGAFISLRVAIILTIQVVVGSVIATGTLRYGKKYLGLRIVMYIALGYLDIWGSWLAGSITVLGITEKTVTPIFFTPLVIITILMFVGLVTAGSIFGAQTRRKEIELFMKGDLKNLSEGDVDLIDAETTSSVYTEAPAKKAVPKEKSVEERLKQLKRMLDEGIITQEEYQAKRKDIIDKM